MVVDGRHRDNDDGEQYRVHPPVMDYDDIDWVHDERARQRIEAMQAEEREKEAARVSRIRTTWVTILGTVTGIAFAFLNWWKGGGHSP
jgi:hypothetical protein